jgi:transketolase
MAASKKGISQEAISFAGHQKLNKLILIYDENTSTLDGPTSNTMSEDVKERFLSAEWNVLEVKDGNDLDDRSGHQQSQGEPFARVSSSSTPSSASARSTRERIRPMANRSAKKMASPCKQVYGYNYPEFTVPEEVYDHSRKPLPNGARKPMPIGRTVLLNSKQSSEGEQSLPRCFRPERRRLSSEDADLRSVDREATRVSSGHIVSALPSVMPFTLGGSADVAGSLKTAIWQGIRASRKSIRKPKTSTSASANSRWRRFKMAFCSMGARHLHRLLFDLHAIT